MLSNTFNKQLRLNHNQSNLAGMKLVKYDLYIRIPYIGGTKFLRFGHFKGFHKYIFKDGHQGKKWSRARI